MSKVRDRPPIGGKEIKRQGALSPKEGRRSSHPSSANKRRRAVSMKQLSRVINCIEDFLKPEISIDQT